MAAMLSRRFGSALRASGLALLLLTAACGQTGPLVLPDSPPQSAQPQAAPPSSAASEDAEEDEDEE